MAEMSMQRALSLQEAGQFEQAADLFREILRANPTHVGALYSLGAICLQSGQCEEAETILGHALDLHPSFPLAWYARGAALLRLFRWEEAIASLDRALALQPDMADALACRAIALKQLDRPEAALADAERVLTLRSGGADDWNTRGLVLMAVRRLDEAVTSFDRALSIAPDFPEARANRATALLELGRLEAALAQFDAALAANPGSANVWNNRGNALLAMRNFEEAVRSYDRALAIQPDFALAAANRGNALLALQRATRCPPPFVRRLFDELAPQYEQVMQALSYGAPRRLRELAERVLPASAKRLRILDLGCGTGLAGDAFKDLAAGGRLDGLDLSPGMIEAARARGIYDDLSLGDVEAALAAPHPRYDVVLAADTMVYLGDLDPVMSGVAQRLERGGLFLFSVERKEGQGWEQTAANRFRHSEPYLRAAAGRAGLGFAELCECALRREANEPVAGFAVALRKPMDF